MTKLNSADTSIDIEAIEKAHHAYGPITLTQGKYYIEFSKRKDGTYAFAVITKQETAGSSVVADFPAALVQEHPEIGIGFNFEIK